MKKLMILFALIAVGALATTASAGMDGITLSGDCQIPGLAAGNLFDAASGYGVGSATVVVGSGNEWMLNHAAEFAGIIANADDTQITLDFIDQTPGAWQNVTGSITISGFASQVGNVVNVAFGPASTYYGGTHNLHWTNDSITFEFEGWTIADYAFIYNKIVLIPTFDAAVPTDATSMSKVKSQF